MGPSTRLPRVPPISGTLQRHRSRLFRSDSVTFQKVGVVVVGMEYRRTSVQTMEVVLKRES